MPSAPRSTRRRPRAVLIAATVAAALFLAPAATAGVLSTLLGNPVGTVNTVVGGVAGATGLDPLTAGDCDNDGLTKRFAPWNDASHYFRVGGSSTLAPGKSMTTAPQCVGVTSPTARFIGKSADGASVKVEVITESGLVLPVGTYKLTKASAPSPVMLMVANLLAILSDGMSADVQLRLTAVGGTAVIDELWVDPFKRT
jgi:hypothetical protein